MSKSSPSTPTTSELVELVEELTDADHYRLIGRLIVTAPEAVTAAIAAVIAARK